MKTVAFFETLLSFRGTTIAIYDYAHYNEKILGNKSIIVTMAYKKHQALEKFQARFPTYLVHNWEERDEILIKENVNVWYELKYGNPTNIPPPPKGIRVVNHAVFNMSQPHGDVYAGVSEGLIDFYRTPDKPDVPCVPHMINVPSVEGDLREELMIPSDGIVFGYYGGENSFDIEYVWFVIWYLVFHGCTKHYFVFMNTHRLTCAHPQIIQIPGTTDMTRKAKFINTCDAMLHARDQGETFGLAVGEFSSCNKPVIVNGHNRGTFGHQGDACGWCDNHLRILGDKAIKYNSAQELYYILKDFKPQPEMDWNAYREYTPEKIMAKFDEIFLSD